MGRLSSLLIGTITGASAAYFLTTKKGKELTGKVKGFVKEYQENPQEVHDSVKQSAMELSKQASDAIQQTKEKVESGEINKDTVIETVKDKTQDVVEFSQDAIQTIKEKIQQKTGKQASPFQPKQEKESEEIVLELEEETALPEVEEEIKETAVEEE